MTIECTKLYCLRFGLSTFCFVDVLVCRRFGLSMFRCVDVSACRRFGCRRFGLSTFWPVIYKRIHFNTSKSGYKNGHHFADDIFKWMSWFYLQSRSPWVYFLNMINILVYIDLILSTFFQHSNILTRPSHHWCLASNIVLVGVWLAGERRSIGNFHVHPDVVTAYHDIVTASKDVVTAPKT